MFSRVVKYIIVSLLLPFSIVTSVCAVEQNQFVGFEENKGQIKDEFGNSVSEVLFHTASGATSVYITNQGISYFFFQEISDLADEKKQSKTFRWNQIKVLLKGARIKKENIFYQNPFGEATCNYYSANTDVGNLKHYQKVVVNEVYPGIDWILYSEAEGKMKYEFIVHPGADPNVISLQYEGVNSPKKQSNGYTVEAELGFISEGNPKTFLSNTRTSVNSNYIISNNNVRFSIADYDHSQPLVIDPPVVWSTYYGGTGDDGFLAFKHNSKGDLFVLGSAGLTGTFTMYPKAGAYNQGTAVLYETSVITKFDKNGVIKWSTFYGPAGGWDLAISQKDESLYLVGYHSKYSTTFPAKNPNQGSYYQTTNNSSGYTADAFVSKFDSVGALQWATLYGGADNDKAWSVATDVNGDVYFAGETQSTNFPLQNKPGAYNNTTPSGGVTAPKFFMVKFDAAGKRKWSTYCGGSGSQWIHSMASSFDGTKIYLAGSVVWSGNFPTVNPGAGAYYKAANGNLRNMYLMELDTTCKIVWSTFFGGNSTQGWDQAYGVSTDQLGNTYIVGTADNPDFPVTSTLTGSFGQSYQNGPNYGDGGVAMFDKNRKLIWSTCLGGTDDERMFDVIADKSGNLYVCGETYSSSIPIVNNTNFYNKATLNGGDAYIAQFDANRAMTWASFYGGNGSDIPWDLEYYDKTDCVFMGGHTASSSGFNIKNLTGAYNQSSLKGGLDMFIIKMCPSFTLVDTTTPPQCFSGGNGTATATPVGGVAPFTYSWSSGQTDSIATGLSPGTYTVTVTDQSNQSVTNVVVISEPPALTITTNPTQTLCTMNTGAASAAASGGTPGYSYSWSNGDLDSLTSGLAAGVYTVVATDKNGCTIAKSVTVLNINGPTVLASTNTHVSCYGTNDGEAAASVNSGTIPYTYSWSSSPVQTNSTASALAPGIYTVQITDANNCTITDTVLVNGPTEITGTIMPTPVTCFGDADGSASLLSVSGGASNYTYSWNTGSTIDSIANVTAGTYSLLITDIKMCTKTISVTIGNGSVVNSDLTSTPELQGALNGTAGATISGGTAPYTYQWSTTPVQTDSVATGLAAGVYSVVITDSNGCAVIDSIEVELELPCTEPYLPTAFSPNGDLLNELFCIRGNTCFKEFQLSIYNRWGERVFFTKDPKECWDGTYRKLLLDSGVFVYCLLYNTTKDEALIEKKGNITLVK